MDSKNHTVMYLLGLSSIALALAFMTSPNNNNNAMAQQSSSYTMGSNRPNSMTSMGSGLQNQNQNWTGSISLFSPILDAFKSKIHTTLNDATTSAINAVGGAGSNASTGAVAAFIHPENGFLVYNVFVLDPNNNIHRVIIDPGNGKILSNQQMSMMDAMFMMHPPSMGMGGMMMGPPPQASPLAMGMMRGPPSMMMDRGMVGMMQQHGMGMMGGGPGMMMGPPHDIMMDNGMMDNGMGMMGWH
jgi:hypothetical protein